MINKARLEELAADKTLRYSIEKVGSKSRNSWVHVGDKSYGPLNLRLHDDGEVQILVGHFPSQVMTSALVATQEFPDKVEIETIGGFYLLTWEKI